MGIVSWIVLGLVAGMLAKLLMPGKDGGGLVRTTILGVVGSFVGGYAGTFLGISTANSFSILGLATATAGAFAVLLVYKLF